MRLTLRPCNPADIFSIMGVYPGFQPKALPAVPGLEGGWVGGWRWRWWWQWRQQYDACLVCLAAAAASASAARVDSFLWRNTKTPALPRPAAGVGVVAENGAGASKFAVGQRVVGMPWETVEAGSGTWQQFIVVGEACLLAVPDAVEEEAAAQVGGAGGRGSGA